MSGFKGDSIASSMERLVQRVVCDCLHILSIYCNKKQQECRMSVAYQEQELINRLHYTKTLRITLNSEKALTNVSPHPKPDFSVKLIEQLNTYQMQACTGWHLSLMP